MEHGKGRTLVRTVSVQLHIFPMKAEYEARFGFPADKVRAGSPENLQGVHRKDEAEMEHSTTVRNV
jgi:hypothetical protein